MNKIILMGRLTRDPETRYSQSAEPLAITRYGIAVNRRFKREGEPDADFIDCVAFGKAGEFAEKYFKKGMMVCVSGRLQISHYEDKDQIKRTKPEVILEDQEFAESKSSFESRQQSGGNDYVNRNTAAPNPAKPSDDFYTIDQSLDDEDLPF